jgi:TetR/AcrR family transcriptional repressor of bet genes
MAVSSSQRVRMLRRLELRRAAYEVASQNGLQTVTVDRIAQHAGISKGIVHYYFVSKQDIIQHAVRYAHGLFRRAVVQRLQIAKSPSERLWSVIDANFAPEIFEPRYRLLWLSIFEMAKADPHLARLSEIADARTISHITAPLRHLLDPSGIEIVALSIMSLMDGLWFMAATESGVTRKLALSIIADYVRARVPDFDMSIVKLGK